MSSTDSTTVEDVDVELSSFNPLDRDFLTVLHENDGEADTTTIRNEGGLHRQQVHHRYDKLEERGLIEVDRAGTRHGGRGSNSARLTELGERAIAAGLLQDAEKPNPNLRDLDERLVAANSRLNRTERSLRRRIDREVRELESEIGQLRNEIEELKEKLDATD